MTQTASEKGAGLLVDSPGIEDRLERTRLTFEALFRLVEKLGTTFDVSKSVSLILMTLMGQLKLKCVSLYIVVPEKARLEPYRALGLASDSSTLPSMPLASCFSRWVLDADRPVAVDEFFIEAGEAAGEERETMQPFVDAGLAHAMALADQGKLLGMLIYSSAVTGEAFSEFDNELVKMIARFGSITINNAFLYQTALLSKLELEQLSSVKREFISHTSHELRTPITVLKSAIWSLEPDQVGAGVLVSMAKEAVTRLEGKVEYLLSLNDIELNKIDFRFELSEVSSIVRNILGEVLPELEERRVHVDVDDQAPFRKVLIDPGKIAIAIRSILDNAANFVGRGGNIMVTIRISENPPGSEEGVAIGDWRATSDGLDPMLLSSAFNRHGDGVGSRTESSDQGTGSRSYLVVSVKDDGIGIPPEEIQTLAEPFKMASNSTNRNVKGLGIGLSVSQKVVAGHGGTIFCKSALGLGAQFSIWLPLEA